MKKYLITVLSVLLFFFITDCKAQVLNGGLPYIYNYTPTEYKAASQNWCVTHNADGYIYVGNGEGLLQFDGKTWRLHRTKNRSQTRSFDIGQDGKIYIGAQTEIGYFMPDSAGRLAYYSLLNKIPQEFLNFTDIWTTYSFDDKIVFQSSKYIFIYKNDTINVIPGKEQFHVGFKVGKDYYVRQKMKGLLKLVGDSLTTIPRGDLFALDRIHGIFQNQNHKLIITRDIGIFTYDENSTDPNKALTKIETEVENYLLENRFFCSTKLHDGGYAFGTLINGVVITDSMFNIKAIINEKAGLVDNQVLNIGTDSFGNIWTATGNGISHIIYNSPFRLFDKRHDFNEVAYISELYNDRLYVGSSDGLWKKNDDNQLKRIDKTSAQCWSFFKKDNKLFCSYRHGIIIIDGEKVRVKGMADNIWKILPLKQKNMFLAGTYFNGLYLLEYKNKNFNYINTIKNYKRSTRFFYEDQNENIWISSASQGILKLQLNKLKDSVITKTMYSTQNGLPEDMKNYIFKIKDSKQKDEFVYATARGIYKYVAKNDSFIPNDVFQKLLGNNETDLFTQDDNGNIWYQQYTDDAYEKGVVLLNGDFYDKVLRTPFFKFHEIYAENISPVDSSNILFNTAIGVIHYNKEKEIDYSLPFNAHIRRIFTNDTVYFYGNKNNKIQNKDFVLELPYKQNSLTFNFSSTYFEDCIKNKFSYCLSGFDEKWSPWTAKTEKEYTNLFEGDYIFKVKALNVYRKESKTAQFHIRILPPWYRTIIAYVIYCVSLITFIWLIVRLNIRRLKIEKLRLEKIVEERTAEVIKQHNEILEKNIELEQQKEEIKTQAEYLQEVNEELQIQKKKVEQKNISITSSINYAKRIQNALLPGQRFLRQCLPKSFILYKPKDIVSGDFYWVRIVKDKLIFAVADCTGHGVPGAFMSMLGIAFLNETVNKDENLNAANILNNLRNQVKEALGQTGKTKETKDGMDIALCIINLEDMIMDYAGAYSPLYIFRNNELIEYKGDKMPIGIHIKEKETFNNNRIQLFQDDVIYIFSDGFVDQIGGNKGRKFLHKNFKTQLHEIHNKPLDSQKVILERLIEDWMTPRNESEKKYQQVDDIVILGVKIL